MRVTDRPAGSTPSRYREKSNFRAFCRERLASHVTTDHADAVSLNFLGLLPVDEAVMLLSKRRDALQWRLDELNEQTVEGAEAHYGVRYMLSHAQFELDWLTALIDELTAQSAAPNPD